MNIADFDPTGSLLTLNFRGHVHDDGPHAYDGLVNQTGGFPSFADIVPGVPALQIFSPDRYSLTPDAALRLTGAMTSHVVCLLEAPITTECILVVCGSAGVDTDANNNTIYQLSIIPDGRLKWFTEHLGGLNDGSAGVYVQGFPVGVPFLASSTRDAIGNVQLYINGQPTGPLTSVILPTGGANGKVGIGAVDGGTSGSQKLIKGVQIFNFAQTPDQVMGTYLTVFPEGLSGYLQPHPSSVVAIGSHNDYQQTHPLSDALALGYKQFAADVFLQSGELRVSHDAGTTVPGRTLKSLYLDPIAVLAPGDRPNVLAVELKDTSPDPAFNELLTELATYPTVFDGSISILISGHYPTSTITRPSWVTLAKAYDGVALADPQVSWVSSPWPFTWLGVGPMPVVDRDALRTMVRNVHSVGKLCTFWGHPSLSTIWNELYLAGADGIIPGGNHPPGADDIAGLATWFNSL